MPVLLPALHKESNGHSEQRGSVQLRGSAGSGHRGRITSVTPPRKSECEDGKSLEKKKSIISCSA